MNFYLLIIGVLLVMLSLNMNCKSNFSPMDVPEPTNEINSTSITEPYRLDTRYRYPTSPPVNPNVLQTTLVDTFSGSADLYGSVASNLLDNNELIKIPLQYNVPYNEQLRSQEILITPYNRIKYSTKPNSSYKD
jgi:hypothetical protein